MRRKRSSSISVLESADQTANRALEQIRVTRLEAARVEDRPRERDEGRHQVRAKPQLGEQRGERGVPRHPAGNRLDFGRQVLVAPDGCGRLRRRRPLAGPAGEHTQGQPHDA